MFDASDPPPRPLGSGDPLCDQVRHAEEADEEPAGHEHGATDELLSRTAPGETSVTESAASDEAVTCVALSVNLDAFSSMKSRHTEAFDEHLAMHRGLTPRLERSVPMGPVVGHGPRPNVVHVPAGPGWLLIGDANLYQDPWTGYGMDAASTHARLAADAIAAVLTGGDEAPAWRRFRDARDGHGLDDFEMTVGVGRDLRQLLA